MRTFEIPKSGIDAGEPTEYAGKEPEFEKRSLVLTDDDTKVFIVDYLIDKGLYVVGNVDNAKMPFYRISPDKLRRIENKES